VPRARVDTNWHFIDNLSWKLDRHEIKFGYEFRRTFVNAFFDAGYRGRLDFASLEDFLSGTLSGGRAASGDSRRNTFQNSHASYVQDSFRWRRNLTFNLGVRYDYFGVIGEKNGLLSNFDPQRGLVIVGKGGLDRLYERDINNFSPRIGLAWDVTGKGKTVVRAGWGLFYDAFSQDFFVGQLPFNTSIRGRLTIRLGLRPFCFRSRPSPRLNPACRSSPTSWTRMCSRSIVTCARHTFRTSTSTCSRSYSRTSCSKSATSARTATKLFRYRDINQPFNPAVSSARPFDNGPFAPSGGTFFYVNTSRPRQLELQRAADHTDNARASRDNLVDQLHMVALDRQRIRWARLRSKRHATGQQSPAGSRAREFELRRKASLRGVVTYDIPTLSKTFPKFGDGWQFNGIVTLRTGSPFHVNLFDDYNGSGEFFPRPDLVGDPFAGTHSPDNFLNLSAFKVPCTLDPAGDGSAPACRPGTQHSEAGPELTARSRLREP